MKNSLSVMYLKIFILVLFLSAQSRGNDASSLYTPQKIKEFGNYLFDQKDYLRAAMELERYLYMAGDDDSTQFKVGLCHYLRGRYDFAADAFSTLSRKPDSPLYQASRLAALENLTQMSQWEGVAAFGRQNDAEFVYGYLADVMLDRSPKQLSDFDNVQADTLQLTLRALEQERWELREKSPLAAAAMSTVVPGLGKLYLNRSGDALYSFALTAFAGFVAYKSFDASLEVTGVVTSGIALSFYMGTIYGSYLGAKLHNRELYKDWRASIDQILKRYSNSWRSWISE